MTPEIIIYLREENARLKQENEQLKQECEKKEMKIQGLYDDLINHFKDNWREGLGTDACAEIGMCDKEQIYDMIYEHLTNYWDETH
jgi:hypothetical protein